MLQEGDPVALGGEPRMAQPAGRLVEHLPRRELESVAPARFAHHDQALAIRRPVRLQHVIEKGSRSGTGERHAREHAAELPAPEVAAADRDGDLADRRDGVEPGIREAQRPRLRELDASRVELDGTSVKGGAVDDGVAIGGEPGGVDRAPAKGELLVGERRGLRDLLGDCLLSRAKF